MKQKKIISNILTTKRDWRRVDKELPEGDQPVLIRYMDTSQIMAEDDVSIFVKEDLKMARYLKNDNGEYEWVIEPPYTLYDYSMLSMHDKLNPGTLVTHWSVPTEDEITGWHNRLNLGIDWDYLSIKCDTSHQESLYKALMFSSFLINAYSIGATDEKMKEEYKQYERIIMDLQACMDVGGAWIKEIENGDDTDKEVTSTESE